MTELEILTAARELISDPAHWTQGAYARTEDGSETESCHEDAFCFCTTGALRKVVNRNPVWSKAYNVLDRHLPDPEEDSVEEFNDSHTHPEVLALFDAAIKELSS